MHFKFAIAATVFYLEPKEGTLFDNCWPLWWNIQYSSAVWRNKNTALNEFNKTSCHQAHPIKFLGRFNIWNSWCSKHMNTISPGLHPQLYQAPDWILPVCIPWGKGLWGQGRNAPGPGCHPWWPDHTRRCWAAPGGDNPHWQEGWEDGWEVEKKKQEKDCKRRTQQWKREIYTVGKNPVSTFCMINMLLNVYYSKSLRDNSLYLGSLICCKFSVSIHHNYDPTHLRALSDRLVIEVQEARSRCFSFGQNLLRLLHVLQKRHTMRVLKVLKLHCEKVGIPEQFSYLSVILVQPFRLSSSMFLQFCEKVLQKK